MTTGHRLLAMTAFGLGLLFVVVVIVFGFPSLTDDGGPPDVIRPCLPDTRTVVLPFGSESASGRWRRLPPFPIAQDELRAAAVGRVVYIGAGLRTTGSDFVSSDVFFALDPRRGTYRTLPPLPRRVDHPAFVAARGDLYLIGGYNGWLNPTAEAFAFSPETGAWTELDPMAVPRGSPGAAAIDGKIYVAGGATGTQEWDRRPTGKLEIFDIATGRWSMGPSMPTARHHAGAAAVGGHLYVVGGRAEPNVSLDVVERFDPRTGRWETVTPLPLGVGALSAVGAGGHVIAIGGGDDDEAWVTPATWSYAPAANRWQRLADLRTARHGHGAAAVGDDVYVFGGAPCPGYGYTSSAEKLSLDA